MRPVLLAIIITMLIVHKSTSVRLHKLFQFIDGYKSEHDLQGFLHVGTDYAVFIRTPKAHDKYIIYELYDARTVPVHKTYKPSMLAIAKVPIEYLKEQLKTFRGELYKAKHMDDTVVPGTQVKTLREWQIDRALSFHGESKPQIFDKMPILRTVL